MDVAVVYAPEDAPRIREIAEALGREGLKCLIDRTIPPGKTYEAMAAERLDKAGAVLVAWSPSLAAAQALVDEAAAARDRGKAFAVLLTATAAPSGFADLPFSDLSAWPRAAARDALDQLASELKRRADPDAPPRAARPRFMRTAKFWLFSFALALALGGLLFLSPEGQVGRGFGIAGRANSLAMSIVYGFVFISFARAALHLSGRLVGQESKAYFSKEFLRFGLVVGVLALFLGLSGASPQAAGRPPSSFLYNFASAIVVLAPLGALGVAMFRAMRRLLFGRPEGE